MTSQHHRSKNVDYEDSFLDAMYEDRFAPMFYEDPPYYHDEPEDEWEDNDESDWYDVNAWGAEDDEDQEATYDKRSDAR